MAETRFRYFLWNWTVFIGGCISWLFWIEKQCQKSKLLFRYSLLVIYYSGYTSKFNLSFKLFGFLPLSEVQRWFASLHWFTKRSGCRRQAFLCVTVRLLYPSLKVSLHNANISDWSHCKVQLASIFLMSSIEQELRCWGEGRRIGGTIWMGNRGRGGATNSLYF